LLKNEQGFCPSMSEAKLNTAVTLASLYENNFAVTTQRPILTKSLAVSPATYSPQLTQTQKKLPSFSFDRAERFRVDSHAPFISHKHAAVDWSGVTSPGPAVYDLKTNQTMPRVTSVPWVFDKKKAKRQREERAHMLKVNRGIGPGSYDLRAVFAQRGGAVGHENRFRNLDNGVPGPDTYRSFADIQAAVKQAPPHFSFGNNGATGRLTSPQPDHRFESMFNDVNLELTQRSVPGGVIAPPSLSKDPKKSRWEKDVSVISKQHCEGNVGQDSPGPALYTPLVPSSFAPGLVSADSAKSGSANGLHWVP
jgi:hypothetical protein